MKYKIIYFFLFVALTYRTTTGQVVYDTIPPDTLFIGGLYPDEMMVFRDSSYLIYDSCHIENLPDNYKLDGTVIIETTFGKDGQIKDTKIVRSINPIYDSIAFNRIQNINGWLPSMLRGRFVSLPMTLPVKFENGSLVNRHTLLLGFGNYVSEEEYLERKKTFDFIYSDEPNLPIITDKSVFKSFLLEQFKIYGSSFIFEYTIPNIFKSSIVKTNLNHNDDNLFIVTKGHIYHIEEIKRPKRVLLERKRDYILIAYRRVANEQPQIAIYKTEINNKEVIHFEFNNYNKSQLIEEIKKYAP